MTVQAKFLLCAVAVSGFAAFAAIAPAQALSMSECSAKYKEAKNAGTLNGQKWNDFRKAECGADATAAPAAAPAAPPPIAETKPAPEPKPVVESKPAPAPKPKAAADAAPTAAPAEVGNAVFPSVVDPKYASEKPYIARRKTCDDQYKVNKDTNGNGGLKWTQKGGGYYSECNKKLKGV